MNRFRKFLPAMGAVGRELKIRVGRYRLALAVGFSGLMLLLTAQAQNAGPLTFSLAPPAGAIATCLPNATARVNVFPKEDTRGVDTLDLKAAGLPGNTEFTVFLTELPAVPFGAVEYIGDFTTNAEGKGSMRADAIIEEAFVRSGGVRSDLNHVVIWFADPAADDFCFARELAQSHLSMVTARPELQHSRLATLYQARRFRNFRR